MPPSSRILIVDDEVALAEAYALQLRQLGFEVDTAHNGADGLALARLRDYDAVICDVLMPIMDGQQMYEQLRSGKPTLTEKFIFISGMSSLMASVSKRFVRSTATDLAKPFVFDQLVASLRKIIPPHRWPKPPTTV